MSVFLYVLPRSLEAFVLASIFELFRCVRDSSCSELKYTFHINYPPFIVKLRQGHLSMCRSLRCLMNSCTGLMNNGLNTILFRIAFIVVPDLHILFEAIKSSVVCPAFEKCNHNSLPKLGECNFDSGPWGTVAEFDHVDKAFEELILHRLSGAFCVNAISFFRNKVLDFFIHNRQLEVGIVAVVFKLFFL